MKGDKPYEPEHACCWRCCSFQFFVSKFGLMACKEHPKSKVEPNHFCNAFATSEADRQPTKDEDAGGLVA